jgi:hypothetical protein
VTHVIHAYRDDMRDVAITQAVALGRPVYVRSVCGRSRNLPADLVPGRPLHGVTCKVCRRMITVEIAAEIPQDDGESFRVRASHDPSWQDPTAAKALRMSEHAERHERALRQDREQSDRLQDRARIDWSGVVLECVHVGDGAPTHRVDETTVEGRDMRLAMCDPCCWSYDLGGAVPLTSGVTIFRA